MRLKSDAIELLRLKNAVLKCAGFERKAPECAVQKRTARIHSLERNAKSQQQIIFLIVRILLKTRNPNDRKRRETARTHKAQKPQNNRK